jgi:hypothetical protein
VFTLHVPNLITVEVLLFFKSQFTKNAQNVLHLNHSTYLHVWSWTFASFQRSRGGCKWFHKNALVKWSDVRVCLHFQLELNGLGFFSAYTYKNQKDLFNWPKATYLQTSVSRGRNARNAALFTQTSRSVIRSKPIRLFRHIFMAWIIIGNDKSSYQYSDLRPGI